MINPKTDLTKAGRENWVHDEDAKECTLCGKAFGLLTRKHHCRHCGHIFCGSCSNFNVTIHREFYADGETKEKRVCCTCYAEILKERKDEEDAKAKGIRSPPPPPGASGPPPPPPPLGTKCGYVAPLPPTTTAVLPPTNTSAASGLPPPPGPPNLTTGPPNLTAKPGMDGLMSINLCGDGTPGAGRLNLRANSGPMTGTIFGGPPPPLESECSLPLMTAAPLHTAKPGDFPGAGADADGPPCLSTMVADDLSAFA